MQHSRSARKRERVVRNDVMGAELFGQLQVGILRRRDLAV